MNEENRTISPDEVAEVAEFLAAVEHALRPTDLSALEHEHLVQEALMFAPTAEELADAAAFRDELAAGTGDAAFLQEALRAALQPRPAPTAAELDAQVTAALEAKPTARVLAFRPRLIRSSVVVVVAMAAAVLLYLKVGDQHLRPEVAAGLQASLVPARSTQELFDQPFDTPSQKHAAGTSLAGKGAARIDRIAAARDSDYRHNRFARWGVK